MSYTYPDNPISIYIHWPFCTSKCPYCAFNSYPVTEVLDFERWKLAYIACIRHVAERSAAGRTVTSIYFGGGTPSLLSYQFLESLLSEIDKCWAVSKDCEISIEMNPGYVTEANVRDFKAIGINRVSIGVQSLTSEGLRVLGRKHTVENALLTIKACAALFSNYSIDLIYAWPNHTLESWKKELVDVFALNLSHISFYQLVIEDDSTFGHMYSRGELLLPDDDTCANMFEYLQEATDKAGIPAYEISNHAVPGFECRHNISYWKYLDYVGIGPGAHSRITLGQQKYATVHESNPKKWLNSIMDNQHILEDMVPLSQDEQAKEAILVGLRMVEGIDIRKLPLPLNQIINLEAYERLIKENYLVVDGDILTATYKGRKRLNALIAYLIR